MKKFLSLLILMVLVSSFMFAQTNTKGQIENKARISIADIDPAAKVNPYATTFADDLFDHQFDFPCGDASGEAGIETNGEYIYTSKWNGDGFFCYEMDGTYLGWFPVTGEAAVRDLAYDGTYFYGAAANTQLFEMDFNGQSGTIVSILSAAVATRACAYNPDYDAFYGNNWSDPITLYDRSGSIINQFNCGIHSSYYGLTYVTPSNEGPWLYGFAQAGSTSQAVIVQIDAETGAETGITFDAIGYSATGTGIAGGLAAFDTYAPGLWTLLGIIQNETIFGVEGGVAGPPPDFDAGITEIISPNNGINLSDEVVSVNIFNYGQQDITDIPVGFVVDNDSIIMEVASGPISSGSSFEYTFTALANMSAAGQHNIEVCTFLDGDEYPYNDCQEKSIYNSIQINDQTFNLSEGFQFISSYINPIDPDMTVVMADILNENLGLVRNSQGQTLRKIGPNWVNGIGDWIIEEGYLVKMLGEDSFTIEGELVNPSTPIPLFAGYQFVSYLPTTSIDAFDAFESIIGDSLIFIRNSNAETLRKIGPNWVNGIGNCIPGEGYLVKMFADDILIYPGSFICGDPFIDSRNGQTYNTAQIGDQCWMAENLNIGDRIDGVQTMSNNGVIEKYCYDNDSMNCEIYGGLYQWNEMMQYSTIQGTKGICPDGWHLPSDAEWFEMENYLDPSISNPSSLGWRGITCGEQLLEGGSSGFEALLAGKREWNTGEFTRINERAYFWTSTINPYNTEHSWFRQFNVSNPQAYRNGASKFYGISVRCVRDEINTCVDPIIDPRDGKVYNIIQIGNQCWMADNLNIGFRIDGIQTMTNNSIIEKYCYDDDTINCETYGGLYQWNEMMQYSTILGTKGICPDGWHLPTDTEWFEMENHLDPGINNPSSTGWRGVDCGIKLLVSGSSGFEAQLSGKREYDTGSFTYFGNKGYFWTSTINPYNTVHAWWRMVQTHNNQVYRNGCMKAHGFSVRCLRDETSVSSKKMTSTFHDENLINKKNSKKQVLKTDYFTFTGGNPADPVYTIYIEGLEIGDEVAAFDRDIIIGALKVNSENTFKNELSVFSTIVNGKGYQPGNTIVLKVWDVSTQSLIPFEYTMIDPYNEAYMKNTYPDIDGFYSVIKISKVENKFENIEENISIFPNPSNGIFNISVEGIEDNIKVRVFDVQGNEYGFFEIEETKDITKQQLDLKELSPGVYFISINGNDFCELRKIVIQ